MNQSKIKASVEALNGIARKVYDHVPDDHPAKPGSIMATLYHATGSKPELQIVEGCLAKMVEIGIVREEFRGHFVRVQGKPTPAVAGAAPVLPASNDKPAAPSAVPATALDKLAELAEAARDIAKMAHGLADSIDDAAIQIDQAIQDIKADTAKFTQFRELLKSFQERA